MKAKINKTQENSKCRMCGKDEETVIHMLRESSKLSQTEYKRHNDWFGTKIHLKIFRKYVVEVREKWYKHQLVDVMENDKAFRKRFIPIQSLIILLIFQSIIF